MLYDSVRERRLEEGLDFMIKHVDDSRPAWPRLIAAGRRWNIVAPSKQVALARFKAANLMDCRISAYNIDEKNKKARKMAPSVLQIDEDKEYFATTGEFELTSSKTNINFKERLDGHPTQIWTGNGYHWIQPQFAIILEEPPMFKKFKEPSRRFLHFEEQLLSGGKADPNHSRNTSFGNMWLRVPGSLNSNQVHFDDKGEIVDIPPEAEVRVVQCWDGNRPSIKPLLPRYYIWLESQLDKSLDKQIELENKQECWSRRRRGYRSKNTINWIEKLIETPLSDFRKCCIRLILARYLMNVRGLSREDTYDVLVSWLNKCDLVCRLDFDINQKVDEAFNMVENYLPMGKQKINHDYNQLYILLEKEGVIVNNKPRVEVCA